MEFIHLDGTNVTAVIIMNDEINSSTKHDILDKIHEIYNDEDNNEIFSYIIIRKEIFRDKEEWIIEINKD